MNFNDDGWILYAMIKIETIIIKATSTKSGRLLLVNQMNIPKDANSRSTTARIGYLCAA